VTYRTAPLLSITDQCPTTGAGRPMRLHVEDDVFYHIHEGLPRVLTDRVTKAGRQHSASSAG
jgi:hypothetical protein